MRTDEWHGGAGGARETFSVLESTCLAGGKVAGGPLPLT